MKVRIVRNPKIMVGKPIIEGTRLTVEFILNLVEHDQTIPQIAKDYEITEDQVKAALNYAKKEVVRNFPPQVAIAHEIFIRRKHQ